MRRYIPHNDKLFDFGRAPVVSFTVYIGVINSFTRCNSGGVYSKKCSAFFSVGISLAFYWAVLLV